MLLDVFPFLWTFLDTPSIISIGLTHSYLKNMLNSLLVDYGVSFSDLLVNFQFEGYCIPFRVNDSPNLLQLEWCHEKEGYREGIYRCYFETKDCEWVGKADTFDIIYHEESSV